MEILKEALFLYALVTVALLWLAFAEHPTARRLRAAIIATLGL
jgi:hypothetical protein